ncbi:UbiH/UbiF family hydroxylase [Aquabacter spiritensis]|uniref:2-octaprenyl-6-methoxyphenol hydroxylase n=1 Tax=Aquabacter spiritensis TaxID=933073 RepID=A0A4R3LPS0_9HYPH|nr:UbiH/UbiF family hydroxylase [Aquabacter spiritensis]TCT02390.1 2-octaprenyl-6-methoxyphenol hydroxylase [Aquabacter spiritensis]
MAPSDPRQCDVAVVGAGPSGLATAIGLAQRGVRTALVTGPARGPDTRTTALMEGSVRFLDGLGLWDALAPHAAPLRDLRLIDATRRLVRAPEVLFRAAEIGLEAFGYNIENDALRGVLREAAGGLPNLTIVSASVEEAMAGADEIVLGLDDGGSIRARLAIAADGRHSRLREAAGIAVRSRAYPQVALTFTVRHTRPHEEVSTEFHSETGPFTLVPLPGLRSSIVCVVDERTAVRLLGLDPSALARELERRAGSLLGAFTLEDGRGAFPLAAEAAEHLIAPRLVLIAEAAHVMPPIGAQGLNLGLRDAAAIVALAGETVAAGGDPGAEPLLARYAGTRSRDIETRMAAVDVLNRSLLSDLLPVQGMRGLGLYLMERIGPLRRGLMRLGAGLRAA